VICGARGDPGTVAPFRAWRGSRDLVAQSPKFHAPAVAHNATANRSLTHSIAEEMQRQLLGSALSLEWDEFPYASAVVLLSMPHLCSGIYP
jgi:hypothetical protein